MNGLNPDLGSDGPTDVSSLRALLGREEVLPPARAAAIVTSLAQQLDAVPPSDPIYGGIGLDTISVEAAAGQPDKVHVLDWDLGGAVAAEDATAQARSLAAQRALASVATALLTGKQPEASERAADLVRASGLPPACGAILDRALAKTGADDGFDSLTEFATALTQALQPGSAASGHPPDPLPEPRRAPLAARVRMAWARVRVAWWLMPYRRQQMIVIALSILIPALGIGLPVALKSSPGLNERTWPGWPGAPVVSTIAVSARGKPPLGDSGNLWVSPDGTRLLTVDDETGAVTQLNLRSGATTTLPALAGYARLASTSPLLFGLAASPDLTVLAAADITDVFTQQAATGRQLGDVHFTFGTNGSPAGFVGGLGAGEPGVAFSPDGSLLAYNDSEGRVYLLDVATQRQRQVLRPPRPPFDSQVSGRDSFAFSPDGGTLAVGTEAGTIYLWDLSSGDLLATMADPNGSPGNQWPEVNSLAFGAGGSLLLAGNEYGTVSVWSVTGHRLIGVLSGTPANKDGTRAGQIMFTPDGAIVAVGFGDGTVRLWSVATGRRLAVITDAVNTSITNPMAFGLSGRLLVSWAGLGDGVTEWNLARS